MQVLSALVIGFLSGLLVYFTLGIIFVRSVDITIAFGALILAWVITTRLVHRNARSAAHVWQRGGLVGAIEWLLVGFSSILFAGHALRPTTEEATTQAGLAGAGSAAGLLSLAGVGLSVVMALTSLLVWFVAKKSEEELAGSRTRMPCPQCGRSISVEAKQCRFCGDTLAGMGASHEKDTPSRSEPEIAIRAGSRNPAQLYASYIEENRNRFKPALIAIGIGALIVLLWFLYSKSR